MASEDYGRLKLLFVDDASHTRLMLKEMLSTTPWWHAEIVPSVAAAFKQIRINPPDLVFTDWEMPGENGIDLIRGIRERPDVPDPLLPVILLTGNGDAAHALKALRAGAVGYLVKPTSVKRITERITDAVTKPPPFVISREYIGPERRQVGRQTEAEDRNPDQLPSGVMLPPDGLLLAKVQDDRWTLREALRRRATAIAMVRRYQAPASVAVTGPTAVPVSGDTGPRGNGTVDASVRNDVFIRPR